MSDEISETAKAVQEVAKTTSQGIQATEKVGEFFSKVMSESIDATCGMIADTLKYHRWKNQVRLVDKCQKLIEKRELSGKTRIVPPKIAIPILQNASIEDDDLLHDLWAELLITAMDPSIESPRSAFIEIIKQMEPIDVKILKYIYDVYESNRQKSDDYQNEDENKGKWRAIAPNTVWKADIIAALQISDNLYRISADNLIRLRLIEPFVEKKIIEETTGGGAIGGGTMYDKSVSFYHGSDNVGITCIGVAFVRSCISPPILR